MIKDDLINSILKLNPDAQHEKLQELSCESLVLIRVQLEFEHYQTIKQNNSNNKTKK